MQNHTYILTGWLSMAEPLASPPTQYRLSGRQFYRLKRPNQQYQSTEGTKNTQITEKYNKWTHNNTANPLVQTNIGWLGDSSHRGQGCRWRWDCRHGTPPPIHMHNTAYIPQSVQFALRINCIHIGQSSHTTAGTSNDTDKSDANKQTQTVIRDLSDLLQRWPVCCVDRRRELSARETSSITASRTCKFSLSSPARWDHHLSV